MHLTKNGAVKEEGKQEGGGQGGTASPSEEIRISVRGLVEFVLRHGDIDNRHQASPEDAMQEGGRIHRKLQKRMGAEYQAEVSLKHVQPEEGFSLVIEGRADGIIQQNGQVTIDEIKGTYREVARMREALPLHLAQAKCYAYIYALQQGLESVKVRMTYCNLVSEEVRYFHSEYAFRELEGWFRKLTAEYMKWARYSWEWLRTRQASIDGLKFPFSYREGQKELVTNVYKTIYHKKKLFIQAPTGAGKTMSAIFPAVSAMGKNMGEKLFYLTAKTITRTVAEDAIQILRNKGLRLKSIILTAKEKICFMESAECNPEYCPYAKGHYDRINGALFEMLANEESFGREKIEEYARRHCVCPFELCLDASLFADAVICDYNYLFDPYIYLKRFFSDRPEGKYLFLIDEAHNLLERGREMYSAMLYGEQFYDACTQIEKTIMSEKGENIGKNGISGQVSLDMTSIMTETSVIGNAMGDAAIWDAEGDVSQRPGAFHGGRSVLVRQGYGDKLKYWLEKCRKELLELGDECGRYRFVESVETLVQNLMRVQSVMDDYLSEPEEAAAEARETLLELYFDIGRFLSIYELLDENYVKYSLTNEYGDCMVKLFCVNPCENLKSCMMRGRSSILFSATFLPIQYYKGLLGGGEEDYEVYATSVFDPAKRGLFIARDVTSKYTRRSEGEYYKIARYIEEIVKCRRGNYMVFCPSYAFLRIVYEAYSENFAGEDRECLLQGEAMSEAEREAFLARFQGGGPLKVKSRQGGLAREGSGRREEASLIGFCVLGGIFSEGIDLKNDTLIGAVIVGTGLPQVGGEREILKEYFDGGGENGFDYAYRFPGMNKVLQAAGRVIRTVEDVGVVALLDERFLQYTYRRLFPREWQNYEEVTADTAAEKVRSFWERQGNGPLP